MTNATDSVRTARGAVCVAVLLSLSAAFHLGGGHPRGALLVLGVTMFVAATAQAVQAKFQTTSVTVAVSLIALLVGFIVVNRTIVWIGF